MHVVKSDEVFELFHRGIMGFSCVYGTARAILVKAQMVEVRCLDDTDKKTWFGGYFSNDDLKRTMFMIAWS